MTIVSAFTAFMCAAPACAQTVYELPDEYPYPASAWSPYIVGALIGVLTLLTLTLTKRRVGASSGYVDAVGLIGRVVAPRHITSLSYFQKEPPTISWTLLFVLGAMSGSFLSAWTGGEITGTFLQDLWVARFGDDSGALRTVAALLGGITMAYGARLAGGCTSGHGISGTLQLAVGPWVAVICFFIGGIITAMLLYRL